MTRRALNLATAVLAVLLTVIVAYWIRSYYVRDILAFGVAGGSSHMLQSILGRVHVVSSLSGRRSSGDTFHSSDRLSPNAIWNGAMSGYPVKVEWHFGCVFQRYRDYHMPIIQNDTGFTTSSQLVVVPYWWIAMLIGILPAVRLAPVAGQRRRKSRAASCPASNDMHNNTSEPSVAPAP